MKTCSKCAVSLPLAQFGVKKKGVLRAECNGCRNARRRQMYADDEEFRLRALVGAAKHRRPYKEWTQEAKDAHKQRKMDGALLALPGYKPVKHQAHVDAWHAQQKMKHKEKQARPELHDAHVRTLRSNAAAEFRRRMRVDAGFRLNMRLRVQIRKALKGKKAGRSWEQFVGYSLDDLVRHLGRMLPKKVTLERALSDGWHIDHIVPKSTFNLADASDLRAAWCLSNLRLIPAEQNLKKGATRTNIC